MKTILLSVAATAILLAGVYYRHEIGFQIKRLRKYLKSK